MRTALTLTMLLALAAPASAENLMGAATRVLAQQDPPRLPPVRARPKFAATLFTLTGAGMVALSMTGDARERCEVDPVTTEKTCRQTTNKIAFGMGVAFASIGGALWTMELFQSVQVTPRGVAYRVRW